MIVDKNLSYLSYLENIMKRTLLIFTSLVVFAFAFSGAAQALPVGTKHVFHIFGESFKVKEAYLKDGSNAHIEVNGAYLKDSFPGAKGTDIYTKIESTSDFLYQYETNAQLDKDRWKVDSNPGLVMGRFSVYNYNNYAANQNSILENSFVHGVAEYSLNVQQYLNYGAKDPKWNLSTNVDFYYWNNANPNDRHASWFILTDLNYKLGTVTAADGTDYHMYLEFKSENGLTWPGLERLSGKLYDDALASLGLAAGTELWGLYVPGDGVAREVAFDIKGYAVDPYATPIPGAVWLMGTGVVGLLALRRRGK